MINANRYRGHVLFKGKGRAAKISLAGFMQARLMLVCGLMLFGVAITGCASTSNEANVSPRNLLWPPPPAVAKIQYMNMIMQSQDIGARDGFFAKLADFVLGSTVEAIVKPYGLVVDGQGRLIVVDSGLKRLHIFDIKDKDYEYIDHADETYFKMPIGAATDAKDDIYVTDSELAKVFVFNSKGRFLSAFEAGARPTGIAINKKAGLIYVADTVSHNIRVHDLSGALLKTIGRFGTAAGEFNRPVDLFVDRNGELYVADTMNFRIEIFNSEGAFVTSFGRHGDGTGDFGRPKGISVDSLGNIYVVEATFDTVQIFNRKGEYLINFGTLGSDAGAFWLPSGIYIDGTDKIYVADTFNRRVQVFEYIGDN